MFTLPMLCDRLTISAERVERRRARIPLFKQFMGTDEITIEMYLGALFDYHWNDHAGQLEKIRQTVGLDSDAAAKPGGVRA